MRYSPSLGLDASATIYVVEDCLSVCLCAVMARSTGVRRTDTSTLLLLATLLAALTYSLVQFHHETFAYPVGACSFVLVCYVGVRWLRNYRNSVNSVCFIVIENRLNLSVCVEWGRARDNAFTFAATIRPLEPNRAISRYIESKQPPATSMDRPCVRISHYLNGEKESITIILWELDERCHTKVYEIREKGIVERRNPTEHHWLRGDLKTQPSKDDVISRLGYLGRRIGQLFADSQ